MKENELRKLAVCGVCDKKIGHTMTGMFMKVTTACYRIDNAAIQRKAGLENMLGNATLAMVMGPDEDLATELHKQVTFSVCSNCMEEKVRLISLQDKHEQAEIEELS